MIPYGVALRTNHTLEGLCCRGGRAKQGGVRSLSQGRGRAMNEFVVAPI